MSRFESRHIGNLAEQLIRGPVRLRLRQLAGVDFLLSVIDDDKDYPFDFVRHALTGYRQPAVERDVDSDATAGGASLRADLIHLAEMLSDNARISMTHWGQPLWTVNELADRFGVSTKTIFRWRRRGLAGWKFRCDDRRQRLAFPDHCVRRFVAENVDLVNRGSNFSQLSREEREEIVARARELVAGGERTVNSVAKRICEQTGRAVETIRLILKHFDEARPKAGLFNRSTMAVAPDDRRLAIWEAYVDGATVEHLAERFGRSVRWIYAALTEMRARDLRSRKIEFVESEEFDSPTIEQDIEADAALADPYDHSTTPRRVPPDLPPYLRHLFRLPLLTPAGEAALFRKMNFLRCQADRLREALDPETATARQLDEIEGLVESANRVKNQIVQANLRLVVSIAKRHANPAIDFFEIVSDGNISLMRAVDKFDYSRGFKFSTYASWAIIKNFARTMPDRKRHQDRYQTGRDELLGTLAGPAIDEPEDDYLPVMRRRIDAMLETLDEREQSILRQRFGLDRNGGPKTLEQIGQRFGVSKERIRQLEARAMAKLRSEFEEEAETTLAG
ncbi:MAG: sigma-70 family RNA polymerase sigma factor [Phycisphaerae bacterium]|nr:sigma-70 family RNA polymerase sigma factor [Phycisphaerae bacterium]